MMIKRILSTKVIMSLSQKSKMMKKMSILIWMWTLKALKTMMMMMTNTLWKLDQPYGSSINHKKKTFLLIPKAFWPNTDHS